MFRWLAWLLERDIVSTPLQERDKPLSIGDIDEMLKHHADALHKDPDPLSRWARILTADKWLDCRLRLRELNDEQDG